MRLSQLDSGSPFSWRPDLLTIATVAVLAMPALTTARADDQVQTAKESQTENKVGETEKDGKAEGKAEPGEKQRSDRYIRILTQADKPVAMQTSIVRFRPAAGSNWARLGVTVDLIGAVHVGEASYYQSLNKEFVRYDALLFELVAPEGTVIPKGGGKPGGSPISAIQGGMKDLLGLEFQLEQVDYTRKNFVHADMTPQEMSASMKDRGESVLKMIFQMMGQGFAQQAAGKTNDVEVIMALFAPDRDVRLKRILARQVADMESLNKALAGKDGSSTLIGERNRKALEVLEREVNKGKRRVAIFYGAGHLPDFERRLAKDYKMEPAGDPRWFTAWDLASRAK